MIGLIKRKQPHIVHTHLFKSDFHGRLAARLADVPVVVSTLHSIDRWARKWPLGAVYGWTASFADCIIAVSDDVRAFHLSHTGVPEEKYIIIENGVDIARYSQSEAETVRKKMRETFGIGYRSPLFGIIGRLTPAKDHKTLLKAASIILNEKPDARFLVVGDGPLRKMLEEQTKELGISSAVHFTGFRNDIPEIMAALDVLVFSSQWEGLPVTLLEGMAASCAVVATAVGGIPAAVEPDKTAFLVPPADALSLARACLRLASNPELRLTMGRAGFAHVTANYSITTMIDRTVSLYGKLLHGRGMGQLIPSQTREKMS